MLDDLVQPVSCAEGKHAMQTWQAIIKRITHPLVMLDDFVQPMSCAAGKHADVVLHATAFGGDEV